MVPDDRPTLVYVEVVPGLLEENSQGRWMPLVPILRVASDFTVGLYVGLPPPPCIATADERGTSPVKLTNHFPQANPPTTLTLERRLTAFVAARRTSECGPPCFTISRKLALRLGRIVNPPRVLFPGSFDTTVYGDTSCIPPFLKFEEQVLDRHGPAQVGFGHRGGLTVYSEPALASPRLSS